MNYDWNWFFSSYYQCAATLIGIIEAFVMSKLLGLSVKVNLITSMSIPFMLTHHSVDDDPPKREYNN